MSFRCKYEQSPLTATSPLFDKSFRGGGEHFWDHTPRALEESSWTISFNNRANLIRQASQILSPSSGSRRKGRELENVVTIKTALDDILLCLLQSIERLMKACQIIMHNISAWGRGVFLGFTFPRRQKSFPGHNGQSAGIELWITSIHVSGGVPIDMIDSCCDHL